MKDLIIYGCGSLGRVIEQIVFDINQHKNTWNLRGFIDDDENKHGNQVAGYPVLGGIEILKQHDNPALVMGFAAPSLRMRAVTKIFVTGHKEFATLIHPLAWISRRVEIGIGSIIYPGVHIDVDVKIGSHCIFNKLCTIGHDSVFEDFVTAAPGVNFGGNIHIGRGCDFGINSATIQGISVGENAVVGAGAIVIKSLPAECVAVGVPAKPKQVARTAEKK